MTPIKPLWDMMPVQPIRAEKTAGAPEKTEGRSFSTIFQEAVDAVKETDAEKTELQYLMATGQLDDPSRLSIASAKAELSINLLIGLRDKSLQAYQELIRMQM